MSIYTTVASSNPRQAKGILSKYGYSAQGVRTTNDLAKVLEQLVGREGEPALRDIADAHPDKGLFMEMYGQPKPDVSRYLNANGPETCSCQRCGCHRQGNDYHNFSGADALPMAYQGVTQGTAVIAAALLLAVAIIVKQR